MKPSELIEKYPFLKGSSYSKLVVFEMMIEEPGIFHHHGDGNFSLVDPEAMKLDPNVQEAIKALNLRETLDENGQEFLRGMGL